VLASACSSAQKYVAPPTSTTLGPAPTTAAVSPATSPPKSTTPANGSAPTTTATAPVTTTTAAPTTQPTLPPTSLGALILANVPSGYARDPDSLGQTGPTNFAQAKELDISPNAQRALLVTGFVAGWQRQWTSSDGYTIDQDFLFEFETPKGAQGYAQHWHDTLVKTNSGSPLTSFTPAFVPGALGLQTADKTGSTAVVMFAKGKYAVEATVNGGVLAPGDPAADQSGPATSLAVAQYQRLP
jgi:hypothetical protein